MAEVQFEENSQSGSGGPRPQQAFGVPITPWMFRFLLKLGIRDEKTAGYILISIAVLFFGVSAYLLFGSGAEVSRESDSATTQRQIEFDSLRPR